MRNKRFLALILSMAMTMSLFGCGGEASQSGGSQKDRVRQEQEGAAGGADGKAAVMPREEAVQEEIAASADRNAPQMSQSTAGMKNEAMAFADMEDGTYLPEEMPENWNTEEYSGLEEPGFASVASTPISTFSADVDTASYSNIRRMIEDGYGLDEIPAGAVRIEEMLNYFSYDYKLPGKNEPFGVTTMIGDCPWNADAKLLQIGLKTQKIDFSEAPASNLVFLLDVSGSMYSNDKLPLLQKSFSLLAEELTEKDRVSIVTYAGSDRVVLKGESGDHKAKIIEAISALEAGGSTNGADGIETAYELAEEYFIEGGNNRVILATDGDLNVGVSSESDLKDLVTEKRKSGVFLSVLGFGTGNIKDNKMEALADNGNGNYAYIDSVNEAKKVLVDEMGATLVTVAKDVKLQVEFNPAYIKGYRLLGYENRTLAAEDFEDDKKDAGEIGAGHTVTALYEIVPVDSKQEIAAPSLKYQDDSKGVKNGEWLNVKIRYKEPEGEESILKEYPVAEKDYREELSQDFYFAAAVAEFGLLLRDSEYKGSASFDNVRKLLKNVDTDNDDYKDEFSYLVKKLEKTQ
ncbi:MAG: VWA domain-containing protein [Lachnoclostridium sp.]|nr:VWA domain-containing protein [Lachnospira sp.]MCM1247037.1 VWA domain-containing protein [Lachnoclostridium sp.]MCM1534811.1 VWA domain-containing protein [Clostridium sp.]